MPIRKNPLLLSIEDDAVYRELIATELQGEFEVILAIDGKKGARQAIPHRPDLILMDLMMPAMDGLMKLTYMGEVMKTLLAVLVVVGMVVGIAMPVSGAYNKDDIAEMVEKVKKGRGDLRKE